MGKTRPIPSTKAETAEKRLEEIANNKSMVRYYIVFENQGYFYHDPKEGEARIYPDGIETVESNSEGVLYIDRRRMFVRYDLENEYKKQEDKQ